MSYRFFTFLLVAVVGGVAEGGIVVGEIAGGGAVTVVVGRGVAVGGIAVGEIVGGAVVVVVRGVVVVECSRRRKSTSIFVYLRAIKYDEGTP